MNLAPLAPSRRTSALLWSVTGTYNDVLAHQKFAVFALVSSLLVPNATRVLSRELRVEKNKQRSLRLSERDLISAARFDRRLNKLVATLLDSLRPKRHSGSAFPAPHWVGDERPEGTEHRDTYSNFPPTDYLLTLVRKYGYDADAAVSALSRTHVWRDPRPDRKRNGRPIVNESGEYTIFEPLHPFRSPAPSRRFTQGGGFSRDQVLASVSAMRTDDNTRQACLEVVYLRRPPKEVAKKFGIKWANLKVYATRVRQRIRVSSKKANKNAGSRGEVLTLCA